MDPETGRIDLDLITTGHGSYERRLLAVMRDEFQKMLNRLNITNINWKKALEDFNEQSDVVSSNPGITITLYRNIAILRK